MQKLNITLPNNNNNNDKVVNITSEDQFKQFLRDADKKGQVVLGLYKGGIFAPIFLISLNKIDGYKTFWWTEGHKKEGLEGNFNDYNYIVVDKMDFN